MVARGEIGLLIVQIGYNNTPYVSADGFYTAVWAILLNTIIGPVVVGLIIKYKAQEIGSGRWGLQNPDAADESSGSSREGKQEAELEAGHGD